MELNSTRDPLSNPFGRPMSGGMASSLGHAATPIKETALSRLEAATKMVEEASRGVFGIADRLCGTEPEGCVDKDARGAGGLFDEIDILSDRLTACAKSIADDVGRIQRRL